MKPYTPKMVFLPIGAALLCALSLPAFADKVTLDHVEAKDQQQAEKKPKSEEGPTWSRKLWNGSFDRAADASGAAAKRLENLDFGDCNDYLKTTKDKPQGDQELYQACVQRSQDSQQYAQEARKIQKQQNVMSIVSKAADVAAVGAVGGVVYSELAVKQKNQGSTYDSAANIERTAGQVSYVSGATDLTMGAYAYVAQKHKLEEIQNTISGTKDGVKASSDPAVKNALTNAVEAAKKAAYSHMMWGAGKLAAGYGMMYLSKQSANQAAKMQSLQDDMEMNQILQARAMANGANGAAPQMVQVGPGIGTVPYYQNSNPQFTMPNSGSAASALATHTGPVSYTLPGGGTTGGSAPLTNAQARSLASAAAAKAGGGGATGASSAPDASPDPAKEKAEKVAKEAMGSSFEMQLTGGPHSYGGSGAPAAGGKDDVPNLASLLGNGSTDPTGAQSAATGISPSQIFQAAQEGNDGAEQGSLAGVNGKSEVSLFDINTAKLKKMFQLGNIGIPKNVEVK